MKNYYYNLWNTYRASRSEVLVLGGSFGPFCSIKPRVLCKNHTFGRGGVLLVVFPISSFAFNFKLYSKFAVFYLSSCRVPFAAPI